MKEWVIPLRSMPASVRWRRVALMDGDIELVADLLVRQLKQSGIKDDSLGIADFCDGLDHRIKQRITSGCLSRGIAH